MALFKKYSVFDRWASVSNLYKEMRKNRSSSFGFSEKKKNRMNLSDYPNKVMKFFD